MSPENARVMVVEDDEDWQHEIRESLQEAGHSVVLTATTRDEVLDKIKREMIESRVNVVTIDANLEPNTSSGEDGQAVAKAVRETAPSIKIVGVSIAGIVRGVDTNVPKHEIEVLGEIVKNL